jgi:hypothetical protein
MSDFRFSFSTISTSLVMTCPTGLKTTIFKKMCKGSVNQKTLVDDTTMVRNLLKFKEI